jgi:hypothetical protein
MSGRNVEFVQEIGEGGRVADRRVVAVARWIGVAVARQVDGHQLAPRGKDGPQRAPVPA